ncbi:hypothetical protein ACWDHW_04100 [Streptomyces melanosporofaciens]|uniref:hypothetical protein n=1 Tax=unclassified Streptomyces TaxID=2593676 RepID=UPI0036C940D6
MTAVLNDQKTGRSLIGEELFSSLAHFVVTHNGQTPERAALLERTGIHGRRSAVRDPHQRLGDAGGGSY